MALPLCRCLGVDEDYVRLVIKEHNLETLEKVTTLSKAGSGCGSCRIDIKRILKEMKVQS